MGSRGGVNYYQRESDEFISIPVTNAGVPVVTGVEYCVVQTLNGVTLRPTTFLPASILEGKTGIYSGSRTPGIYFVWVHVSANPEDVIDPAGEFRIV